MVLSVPILKHFRVFLNSSFTVIERACRLTLIKNLEKMNVIVIIIIISKRNTCILPLPTRFNACYL